MRMLGTARGLINERVRGGADILAAYRGRALVKQSAERGAKLAVLLCAPLRTVHGGPGDTFQETR